MTNKDYALLAGKFLSDKKAKDIVIIDIQGKATFADYFVLCSGTSERQINTLADQPSTTCSLASTVWQLGHQFTGFSFL